MSPWCATTTLAGRKYPGRVIAVNKGLRNAGSTMGVEQQNECVRRYCNPVSLITRPVPLPNVLRLRRAVRHRGPRGRHRGEVRGVRAPLPGAERAAPVVPEAEATLAVTPTEVEVEPSTAV